MNALQQQASQRALLALQLIWIVGLLVSGRAPYERSTWLMEVVPCLILMPILWWTRRRFVFTPLVYGLMTVHGLILMLGGAYTYARVPLGFWMQDWFDFSRNNYDKVGHFAQGFVPAFVTRELLVRVYAIKQRRLLAFLCVSVSLAISALYELIEWWSALLLGSGADEFLGTQGYVWDTQSDMFMALIGASCAMLLARRHDAAMRKLS
jgi:putative membrane protein